MTAQESLEEYDYYGPKAIFDPNYLPPQIFYRNKEKSFLYSLLKDSFYDGFKVNILCQGINGIGKKVLINKVLWELKEKQSVLNIDPILNIDCSGKSIEEFIFLIISEIVDYSKIELNLNSILIKNSAILWNLLKNLFRKINNDMVILLINSEDLDLKFLGKFLDFGKENDTSIIATCNKSLRPRKYDLYSHFDYRQRLEYFTYNQLFFILKNRFNLTFQRKIDNSLIKYISDLIFQNFAPVPGKGVEIMKVLYPFLMDNEKFQFSNLIELIQTQFGEFDSIDEFAMLNYLAEGDPLILIFLDNLASHLLNSSFQYYISKSELEDLYFLACESLNYPKLKDEFHSIIKKILQMGILNTSNEFNQIKSEFSKDILLFSALNPLKLKAMIDVIFGNCN